MKEFTHFELVQKIKKGRRILKNIIILLVMFLVGYSIGQVLGAQQLKTMQEYNKSIEIIEGI